MNVSYLLGGAAGLLFASAILLPGGPDAPRWSMVARLVLAAALIGLAIVDAVGDYRALQTPVYRTIMLVLVAGAALYAAYFAVRHWRDDDALAEAFGPHDSYVVRPHLLSSRARAALWLLGFAALILVFAGLALSETAAA
jgi:hypothetical protein